MSVNTTALEEPGLADLSLILGLINIYQPIGIDDLAKSMGQKNEGGLLSSIKVLLDRDLIKALPDRKYRTTWKGQQAMWSPVLARQRDIQRMWYLAELTSKQDRDKEGE